MNLISDIVKNAAIFIVTIVICFFAAEGILRFKNTKMNNYDIEMWRYSNELKRKSENPVLGHEHVKNTESVLQSVKIRINNWGMRGAPIEEDSQKKRILVLGSSMTLGWGVAEEDIFTSVLQKKFDAESQNVEILNAGIGNYNTVRYVELFLNRLTSLKPNKIIIHFFINDAESLDAGGGNFLLQNSHLAVTTWVALQRMKNKGGKLSLEDHYKKVYANSSPGFLAMVQSLKKLRDYAQSNNIEVFLTITPDVHNLKDYKFDFIHTKVEQLAKDLGLNFIDLLPAFRGLNAQELWSMPGDPHINAKGHKIMANLIYPQIKN